MGQKEMDTNMAKKSPKSKTSLTKADVLAHGCPELVGSGILLHAREFGTGSYGFMGHGKLAVKINGIEQKYQVGVNLIGHNTNPVNAAAKGKTPVLSKDEFLAKTAGLMLALDDYLGGLHPAKEGTAKDGKNVNFFRNGTATIVIDGKSLVCSVNMNVTAIGSSAYPDALEAQIQAE